MEDLEKAHLLERINYLENRLFDYEHKLSKDMKDLIIRAAYLELTDKEGYIKLMNLIKYLGFKSLKEEKDPLKQDNVQRMLTKDIETHDYTEEEKKFVFEEMEKLFQSEEKLSEEEKESLNKISEKADLFVSTLD